MHLCVVLEGSVPRDVMFECQRKIVSGSNVRSRTRPANENDALHD